VAAAGLGTDLYEFTTVEALVRSGRAATELAFDFYFREMPFGAGYAVFCGAEAVARLLTGWRLGEEELEFLQGLGRLSPETLELLRGLRFGGDVDAVPEGTVVFPGEPLVQVRAPAAVAHLVEPQLTCLLSHQTLIATKAARVVEAAAGKPVLEFGLRRAHGPEAALWGARAAYIGGCSATSNVEAGRAFGIPLAGTHPHSLVQMLGEREAFRAFCRAYPDNAILLVDTYDLRQGLERAVEAFRELVAILGRRPQRYGVRIDSGDLARGARLARQVLDAAGMTDAIVVVSSDLDEHVIASLVAQGAPVDAWGVGTRLITGYDSPALGGVYKLAAVREGGVWRPRIKLSANPVKATLPGLKAVWRLYERSTGRAILDQVCLAEEPAPDGRPLVAFDPVYTWRRRVVEDYRARPLLEPLLRGGRRVGPEIDATQARARAEAEKQTLWPEYRRLHNPEVYQVDWSQALYDLRLRMLSRPEAGEGA
jgi:nicotinate phosphoribosyltransferase